MSSPAPDNANNREEEGGNDVHVGDHSTHVDPNIRIWRARDQDRKRKLFGRMLQGAAFETGKELAQQQDFAEHFAKFAHWISENL